MDILDIFVESVFDMALARGNVGVWLKKRFVSFLLAVGSFVFLVMLFSAIRSASVLKIIVGAIGTVIFVILDFRYTFWWLREGRFGADLPIVDKIPLPKGDLMNKPPEDAPFGTKPKEDIWEQIGARE